MPFDLDANLTKAPGEFQDKFRDKFKDNENNHGIQMFNGFTNMEGHANT